MKKKKRYLIIVSVLLIIILMIFFILYIQTKKLKEGNKFCWEDSDCKIQQACGCFVALNKDVSIAIQCKVEIQKLFEEDKSEIEEDDSCQWKLETTIVKCIKNQCTLVEVGK